MTKKFLTFLITAFILQMLHGCAAEPTLAGTWSCTMETSVIGVGITEPTTVDSLITFVFNEDGTGTWTTTPEGRLPIDLPFTYVLVDDTLTLITDSGEDSYTCTLTNSTLKLESLRATLELTRE